MSRATRAISPDDNTAKEESIGYPESGAQPVTATVILKGVGTPLPGMHAASGSWVIEQLGNLSANGSTVAFDQTANGLKMTDPTGEHFDAKLDGTEFPYSGSHNTDKVTLKRMGGQGIQETDMLGGKVVATFQMTVSPDGRTLTMVEHERNGRVNTFVYKKQ